MRPYFATQEKPRWWMWGINKQGKKGVGRRKSASRKAKKKKETSATAIKKRLLYIYIYIYIYKAK